MKIIMPRQIPPHLITLYFLRRDTTKSHLYMLEEIDQKHQRCFTISAPYDEICNISIEEAFNKKDDRQMRA